MANIRFDEIGNTTSTTSTTSTASDTSDSEARQAAAKRRAGLTAGKGTGVKKAKTKTVVTPGTKVSQATIDKIKAMGMKKALAGAGGASAEMREGLKRLYGAKRVGVAAPAKPQSARPQLGGGSKPPIAKPQLGGGMSKASVKPTASKPKANSNPYGGFSMAARALGVTGKTNTKTTAFKADQAKLKKAYDIAKAKKGK